MSRARVARDYVSTELPTTIDDLTGREFGFWKVQSYAGLTSLEDGTRGAHYWSCVCRCGTTADITGSGIRNSTKSCGCRRRVPRQQGGLSSHGLSKHPDYHIWKGMVARCRKPESKDYPYWGGRGITVCDRWADSPQAFFDDMGPRPSKKHSIDREDNFGNYEPGNCRWATYKQQASNRRSNRVIEHGGRSMTLADWAIESGIRIDTLHRRLVNGWDFARAISEPVVDEDGGRNSRRKLNKELVLEIRSLHSGGRSMRSIARQFGVSMPTVRQVVLRNSWSHIGSDDTQTEMAR